MDQTPAPRPPRRRLMHIVRRAHLFAGLFLLPWVLLYAVTAFLFNHPSAFGEQTLSYFGRDALAGSPMSPPPAPLEIANQVVAALQARQPESRFELVDPQSARFSREFAFATVKAETAELGVLLEVSGAGGTLLVRAPEKPKPPAERAPFAIGGGQPMKGARPVASNTGEPLQIDNPLHERVKAAIPVVLERARLPLGEISVTSVPDVTFLMKCDDRVWRVSFNAQTGNVAGRLPEPESGEPLSARRFLTRLHTAHGYPSEFNTRWAWALIVDVLAVVMLFWSTSGLLMWWQLKSARWLGLLVLLISIAAATWIGIGMHDSLASR